MRMFAWWPTLIVIAVATVTDLRSRRIPNWLVFSFLIAGVVVSPWRPDWHSGSHGFGWHGLGQCLAGFALALLINGIPFLMGWTGGGDVKLFAAIGAWVGPMQLFWAVFFTALAGGAMVLCWAVFSGMKVLAMRASDSFSGGRRHEECSEPKPEPANLLKRKMPYAPAIAIGTLLSFFAR